MGFFLPQRRLHGMPLCDRHDESRCRHVLFVQNNAMAARPTAVVAAAAIGSVSCGLGAQKRSPPNIVFVLADDLGWSDLACYGSTVHETPQLDRFARQSVRFTDAYAASPVCSPTRASLMTGKCPARLHMTIWREAALDPPRNCRLCRRWRSPICRTRKPRSPSTCRRPAT